MDRNDKFPETSGGKVIRLVQFQEAPEQKEEADESAIRIQIKVAATPDRLEQKIIRYITTELRSSGDPITITNMNPCFRLLIHALELKYPHEIVMAIVFTSVLDLSAVHHIDLTDEKIKQWNLNEEQTVALRQLRAGADLHHMALEHGLKILYSDGRGRTIEPYESILSLSVWIAPGDSPAETFKKIVAEFKDKVLG